MPAVPPLTNSANCGSPEMHNGRNEMGINREQQQLLRMLPGIDILMERLGNDPCLGNTPKSVLKTATREVIDEIRGEILAGGEIAPEAVALSPIIERVGGKIRAAMGQNLIPLVNATGVVVHTNLGRSLLPDAALEQVAGVAAGYSNLEFNISTGKRGLRYSCVEELLCEISGAEAALAVNNNAGAVLLALETLARNREVIVSRGELVEIGGSFRVPDVMEKSGAILKEVGTTNRTHPRDYENNINENTGLLLKVHTSNYSLVGFTKAVTLTEMTEIGRETGIPVMEDLGSGTFIDFSRYGLVKEPTVQESIRAGVDIVTFSGDKLLGGPQAGIIIGKKELVDRIKRNPLTRALRIDKLTLAALESTLRLYRDERKAVNEIPTLRMLTLPYEVVARGADRLEKKLLDLGDPRLKVTCRDISSRAGGGALPVMDLPSRCVGVTVAGVSINTVEKMMRLGTPPVIGRIEEETFLMDLRTVQEGEIDIIALALSRILEETR